MLEAAADLYYELNPGLTFVWGEPVKIGCRQVGARKALRLCCGLAARWQSCCGDLILGELHLESLEEDAVAAVPPALHQVFCQC